MNNNWDIVLEGNIWITVPNRLFRQGKWDEWARIQRTIISRLTSNLTNAHTYIRFIDFPRGYFAELLKPCILEKFIENKTKLEILLFKDCKDNQILNTIFEAIGMEPYQRCIFMSTQDITNLREFTANIFTITQQISSLHSPTEYQNELDNCRCICYSMDNDLVIGKTDLNRDAVLSILGDTAKEENLNLEIKQPKPRRSFFFFH